MPLFKIKDFFISDGANALKSGAMFTSPDDTDMSAFEDESTEPFAVTFVPLTRV